MKRVKKERVLDTGSGNAMPHFSNLQMLLLISIGNKAQNYTKGTLKKNLF